MFIVLLKFSTNKSQAQEFMEAHKAWLQAGFAAGTFVLAGSLPPNLGGGILAQGIGRDALEALVQADPFVAQGVVSAEIIEMAPSKADERLAFLCA